jgi:hypothetical protein
MATFSKLHLSGSTGGLPIKIAQTATAGTTVHETGTSSSIIDEVWVYATNTSGSSVTLTVEYGGTTNPDHRIIISIPAQSGLTLVLPGLTLSGDGAAARTVRAFASTANVINVTGYVNRIS